MAVLLLSRGCENEDLLCLLDGCRLLRTCGRFPGRDEGTCDLAPLVVAEVEAECLRSKGTRQVQISRSCLGSFSHDVRDHMSKLS